MKTAPSPRTFTTPKQSEVTSPRSIQKISANSLAASSVALPCLKKNKQQGEIREAGMKILRHIDIRYVYVDM